MKLHLLLATAAASICGTHLNRAEAFSPRLRPPESFSSCRPHAASASSTAVDEPATSSPSRADGTPGKKRTRTLGLLTFDLDDSLYPIAPVLHDANSAFVRAMANYGYDLGPDAIVESAARIRAEAGPAAGSALSHTAVRLLAIRREMERKMVEKKLRECAEDWATEVSSLTGPVRMSAERWARAAVQDRVVEAVYRAWEGERHHSAERHLYPEALASLQRIREEHPGAVVGAVTDGRANPLLMVFTLAPYFDFCISWEDDASGRTDFFKELNSVDGNADLQWIYRAALDRYREIAETKLEMRMSLAGEGAGASINDDDDDDGEGGDDPIWIHVGDDLAYDVGGSASCGARTILLDLDGEYRQTAKRRFGPDARMPSWSTNPPEEIIRRRAMNNAAEKMVNKRVSRLSMLADAIDEILKED
jgi:FMN phosphatase YigB (HAD superfamily)